MTPIDQKIIARVDKYDCMEFKSFYTTKEMFNRMDPANHSTVD
jgi:hypothetical protein